MHENGGLLFGLDVGTHGGTGAVARTIILGAPGLGNAAADPAVAFSIAPIEQAQVIGQWSAAGYALIGSYHSHPSGNPSMSSADAAMAEAVGLLLIVAPAPAGEPWQWRLYDPVGRVERRFEIAPPEVYPNSWMPGLNRIEYDAGPASAAS